MIHLCGNSVTEDSAKFLVRERLRYYSQQVSSSVFAAKWRCSSGAGVSTGESCRACENFATWLNVEKYLSRVTALRIGPARAVIGASSIVHTPSVAICTFCVRLQCGHYASEGREHLAFGLLLKVCLLFSAVRPTRSSIDAVRHLASPALALYRRLKYSQQDFQRLSCYPCRLDLAGHLLLHRS